MIFYLAKITKLAEQNLVYACWYDMLWC